jgi:hypothetical protein
MTSRASLLKPLQPVIDAPADVLLILSVMEPGRTCRRSGDLGKAAWQQEFHVAAANG